MDRYVVIGNPVSHSKSPEIHSRFARQTGERLEYTAMHVETGDFARAVNEFFNAGGKGANVTVPFKQEAWALSVRRSPEAESAGAVNTLYRDDGVLCGHNTDGIGLVRDIKLNHGGTLSGKSILILGAGGACRGILRPFLAENPAVICIANRTASRAEELAMAFSGLGPVQALGFPELGGNRFDWVVNASSSSLQGELPPLPASVIGSHSWCYDLMYANEQTLFCRWAGEKGAGRVLDGLGMLVEQAAESFMLWRGVRPETGPVIAALRG